MKVVVTADFHWHIPPDGAVPPCDLLLLAGDVLPIRSGFAEQTHLDEFGRWLLRQPAGRIVGVAGNHDWPDEAHIPAVRALPWTYLDDELADVNVNGTTVKIWGSQRTHRFPKIPPAAEIVLTHGPPHRVLDAVRADDAGSIDLRAQLSMLPKLKLFACGHIHEGYGVTQIIVNSGGPHWVQCVNGAYVDGTFTPGMQPPIQIEVEL